MQKVILFYNGLGIPTRHILDSRGAIPSKTIADAKVAIQEMAEYSQKWHNGTSRSGSTETSDRLMLPFETKEHLLNFGNPNRENEQVLENMDDYHDEGMGDVIFDEPFLREVGINAKRFEGMITIYNGDDEVSEEDKMNGISHSYQKLKGFYKGVLNLGPDYIRDAKMEEWITRGHISDLGSKEISTNIGGEFTNMEDLEVLES
ncbi:hypothetical protein Tco_0228362 [Tanacetum coccineum]